jgi:hypothetical protein
MQVNLLPLEKKLDPSVKYNGFQSFTVANSKITINNTNFHIPTLMKEVKKLSKGERRMMKLAIQGFLVTATSFLIHASKSMAATSVTVATNLPTEGVGMPKELLELMLMILTVAVGGAVLLTIVLLVAAGVLRQFRRGNQATEWTQDIIKGFCQILVAAPLVFLIYFLSTKLFSTSGWFISPF